MEEKEVKSIGDRIKALEEWEKENGKVFKTTEVKSTSDKVLVHTTLSQIIDGALVPVADAWRELKREDYSHPAETADTQSFSRAIAYLTREEPSSKEEIQEVVNLKTKELQKMVAEGAKQTAIREFIRGQYDFTVKAALERAYSKIEADKAKSNAIKRASR